jgi:two-component system phosphate regulon response regulator PhoB
MPRVLIIAEDRAFAGLLADELAASGLAISTMASGSEAVAAIAQAAPDLVVLAREQSDGDGLALCRALRGEAATARVGILVVSNRGTDRDRVDGLEAGADDYVVKPVPLRELALRIQAVLRRCEVRQRTDAVVAVGAVVLDPVRHRVTAAGELVALRPLEYLLLEYLMRRAPRAISRDELLAAIWGDAHPLNTRIVDVQISRLRDQLGRAADLIETVPGHGYRARAGVERG